MAHLQLAAGGEIETSQKTWAMWRLVGAVQELSHARSIDEITAIVRTAARELAGADGAAFVLRDGDHCYYVDEDAIGPLWKGQRFPMQACVSGWAMLNGQPAVIEDIYSDPRVPADSYRTTFVKSLAVIPVRPDAPIGAIGTYWAVRHRPTPDEIVLLQALANTTSVALENVQVYAELERRVQARTRELEMINRELEAFSYSVSHDLRAPVRHISGFTDLLTRELGDNVSPDGKKHLARINAAANRMGALIGDLLALAKIARAPLTRRTVDVSALAQEMICRLRDSQPQRQATVIIAPDVHVEADMGLMTIALDNLLANAWKYTGKRETAEIELGVAPEASGSMAIFVRDNGAGFDMKAAGKLFSPFQRMHSDAEFPGTGIGLATVQRIVHRHGGRIWADAQPDGGATFWFTIPPAVG